MNRDRRLSFELDSKLAELRVCKKQAPVDGSAKKTPFPCNYPNTPYEGRFNGATGYVEPGT